MALLIKQHLCTICKFLCRYCTISMWKCLISRFVENGNTRQRLSFYSPGLRHSPLEFKSRRICQHCRIERDKISVMKFKAARTHFSFKWRFRSRWRRCFCPVHTYPHIYIYIYIYIVARFNSSRVDSTYECQTPQNATLTDQERQEDVQLKVC